MIIFKIVLIETVMMTLASAWSTQYPNFFHTFSPSPTTAMPLPFRSFFHGSSLQPRFYVNQQQFRHPMQLFQPPNIRLTSLQLTRPHPLSLPSYDLPIQSQSLPPHLDTVQTPSALRQDADEPHQHHHHHHVFYYYYFPANSETQTLTDGTSNSRATRRPCNDNPAAVAGCAPTYLPPPPPSSEHPITTTTTILPPIQSSCDDHDDDTIVVDSVNYFPFGRAPIVVKPATTVSADSHSVKEYGPLLDNTHRGRSQPKSTQENKSNFILANYLLPPDK